MYTQSRHDFRIQPTHTNVLLIRPAITLLAATTAFATSVIKMQPADPQKTLAARILMNALLALKMATILEFWDSENDEQQVMLAPRTLTALILSAVSPVTVLPDTSKFAQNKFLY